MDGAEAEAVMVKSPYQRGQTWLSTNIDERLITINGSLVSQVEDPQECLEEIYRLRRQLISVLNPLDIVHVEIHGESFEKMFSSVQVVDGPNFDDADYTEPDGILMFNFSAVVPKNFAEDLEYTVFDLMEVVPSFEFILEFDDTNQIA